MIVAGFGFRSSASAASLLDALEQAVGADRPTHLSAPQDKAGDGCLRAVAKQLQLPVMPVDCEALSAVETSTQSPKAIAARGVGSVAEAAALAAAGHGATLTSPRSISTDRLATCAIAVGGLS